MIDSESAHDTRNALSAELDRIGSLVAGAKALLASDLGDADPVQAETLLGLAQQRIGHLIERVALSPETALAG